MVPFTVYNIQRALGVWPKEDPGVFVGFTQWIRSGWIIMEITTVVMGVAYLSMVRFPFLLFPISFSLWYLSMDLAPLVPGWRISSYTTIRIRISIAMGIAIMLLGYTSETVLGSNPDLGFWLYFFGLLTFCVALNFDFPSSDLYGSLFLLVNMGLVLIGSHLNRTTFHVFGTLGVIEYVVGIYSMRIKTSDSIVLWLLKALVAASLFSQAVSRHGNIEVLGGIVCVLAFNFNFIHFITSSEFYSLLLLTANLGFVSTSSLFSQSLDLWLFILPNIQYLFGLLTSLMVILFHAKIAVKYLKTIPTGLEAHSFLLYRFFSSVALAFVFVFLRQPHLAWIGALGITMAPLCYSQPSFNNNTHQQYKRIHRTITFIGLLFSVSFSIFLDSNILYLISCVVLLITTTSLLSDLKIQGCAFAVLLVLASIPLNSKFLITIGALYIISYLTHLAYNTFRDSLMFPLVLIGLGAVMIASAVQYQQFESDIHAGFDSIIPHTLKALLLRNIHSFWKEGSVTDWISFISKTRFSMASFMQLPFCWVLWPGAMMYALVAGPAPYVAYFCVLCILLVVTMAAVMSWREKMVRHLDDQLEVSLQTPHLVGRAVGEWVGQRESGQGRGIVGGAKGEWAGQWERILPSW